MAGGNMGKHNKSYMRNPKQHCLREKLEAIPMKSGMT